MRVSRKIEIALMVSYHQRCRRFIAQAVYNGRARVNLNYTILNRFNLVRMAFLHGYFGSVRFQFHVYMRADAKIGNVHVALFA